VAASTNKLEVNPRCLLWKSDPATGVLLVVMVGIAAWVQQLKLKVVLGARRGGLHGVKAHVAVESAYLPLMLLHLHSASRHLHLRPLPLRRFAEKEACHRWSGPGVTEVVARGGP
jgi:hypothetical protein